MKRNRYIKVFKEFSWIAFGQFLTVIGSLFGIRLLTSLLSTEQYGELALAMTIGTFLYLTIFGPISNGVYRYFSLATKNYSLYKFFYIHFCSSSNIYFKNYWLFTDD